jgi:hypothetical protein
MKSALVRDLYGLILSTNVLIVDAASTKEIIKIRVVLTTQAKRKCIMIMDQKLILNAVDISTGQKVLQWHMLVL